VQLGNRLLSLLHGLREKPVADSCGLSLTLAPTTRFDSGTTQQLQLASMKDQHRRFMLKTSEPSIVATLPARLGLLAVLLPATWLGAEVADTQPARQSGIALTDALTLNQRERTVLADTQDGDSQLDEAAFYMLLSKAAGIAGVRPNDLGDLDRPAMANLLARPDRYRGWPVAISVRIMRVEQLRAPQDFTLPPGWSEDRHIWKIACNGLDAEAASPQPLLVFTTSRPRSLPPAEKTGAAGEAYYLRSNSFKIQGFFYKSHRAANNDGKLTDFPVVVAWSVDCAERPASSRPKGWWLGSIIGLAIIYLFVRRWSRRAIGDDQKYIYRPLRQQLAGLGETVPEEKDTRHGEDGKS